MSAKKVRKQVRGCYSPEVRTFGTPITSITCKLFDKTIRYLKILDYVPRDLRLRT